MPDNYYSEFNENGVVTPFRDLAACNGVIANTKLIKDTVGWSGKNKAIPQEGYALDGNDSTGFRIAISGTNSLCYIAKVENGKSYIVSREAGNRFRIVGFKSYPTTTRESTARDIYNGSGSENTYTFTNTGNWAYIVFLVNYDSSFDYSTAHGMIRDADILDSTYEPYFGSTAVDWASYAKTGVKNRFDILQNYLYTNKVNETKTSNSIRIVGTESAVYENVSYALQNLAKNTEYIFSTDVVVSVGEAQLIVTGGSSDSGPWTDIASSTSLTSDGKLSIRFNSGNYTYIKLAFMCSLATAAVGDVTYSNIMIYDASDNDPAYAPFAMTNRELTEKVQGIIDAATNAADFAAFKTAIGNL